MIVLYALSGPYFHFSQAITPSLLATIVVPAGVARNIYAGPVHIEYYIDTKDQYKAAAAAVPGSGLIPNIFIAASNITGPYPAIPAVPVVPIVTTKASNTCCANVK